MQAHLISIPNKLTLDNFIKSVEIGIPKATFHNVLDSPEGSSQETEKLSVWGLTAKHKSHWKTINNGDLILFFRNNKIFFSSQVFAKYSEQKLARSIWFTNRKDLLRENLLILTNTSELSVNTKEVTKILGYKSSQITKSITTIDQQKTHLLAEELELDLDYLATTQNSKSFQQRLNGLGKDLSLDIVSKRRAEQHIFSEYLFSGKDYVTCSICHKNYPSDLLVAGHIKKRSDCSDSEKRDLNIVMPVCKFGCDDLYEKGYILINDKGLVVSNRNLSLEGSIGEYVNSIVGKKCTFFSEKNKKYFKYKFKQFN